MDAEVIAEAPDVAANVAVPEELDVRFTVAAAVVELPDESHSVTVIGPKVAVDDAEPDTAVEVIANWLAAPAMTDRLEVVVEVSRPSVAAST